MGTGKAAYYPTDITNAGEIINLVQVLNSTFEVPTSPFLFPKPTHALVEANGQEIIFPKDRGSIHFETELVIRVGKPYVKNIKVDELIEDMTIGIDFTLPDVQNELKKKAILGYCQRDFRNPPS